MIQYLDLIIPLLLSTLRLSTPLMFASLGGLVSERSGIIQIALEGMMIIGALAGAVVSYYTHSAWLGFLGAALVGILFALLKGYFVIQFKTDQIITGTSFNILAAGVAPFITKLFFNSTGSSPSLPIDSRFSYEPVLILLVIMTISIFIFYYTKAGLILQFSGEAPEVLKVSGYSVSKVRYISIAITGALAAMGGATLSVFLSSSYSNNMIAGRGFIALAALILGKWRPIPTIFSCLLFGLTDALQILLQTQSFNIPVQLIQLLPYLITVIALVGFFGQSLAPKSLGQTNN